MKVLIIGIGKLGYKLAEEMSKSGFDLTVMDSNQEIIDRVTDYLDVMAVCANGIEIELLKEINIESYDLLIACTKSDETNTLICTLAKKISKIDTIARIRNPEYKAQIDFIKKELGIDHVINPDFATAREISRYILKNYSFHSENFAQGKVQLLDVKVNHDMDIIDKKIMDISALDEMIIVALKRDNNIIIPHGSTKILDGDFLYILGNNDNIYKLSKRFKINSEQRKLKKVMIFGGGKLGYYLAKSLIDNGIYVIIIEKNYERCKYLSERLNALVINGDGTDINLLEEEKLDTMDAFVSVTDLDEQNLLMALAAKQFGAKKSLVKISRQNYIHVIDKLEVDSAFNPIDITASAILKYIRGGKVISVSLILGGEAEVTEVKVGNNIPNDGIPIINLGLKKGIIIGAVVHNERVIIPRGNTVIYPKDRIIIFCLKKDVGNMEDFLKTL